MVKLFQLRPAELSTESKLVFAHRVGHDVGEMPRDIFATCGRGQADGIETRDCDVWGTR